MCECGKCGGSVRVPDGYEFNEDDLCWECMDAELTRLREQVAIASKREAVYREGLDFVTKHDKTVYEYGDAKPNGEKNKSGVRWSTPREIALVTLARADAIGKEPGVHTNIIIEHNRIVADAIKEEKHAD